MTTPVLKIEKKISAEPIRLFRAWLQEKEFSSWFLSGDEIGIESVTIDPRPGGKFRIDMTLDGKVLPHEGEYITIDEPTKLVFTWRSHATGHRETLVTVTFTALPSVTITGPNGVKNKPQTLVTLTHERLADRKEIEMHHGGWTSILNSLELWHVSKD
ncbi:SRPBCC family protein [Leptospira yasudae]|uniref:SRPBCC domain-containing protein n=1 Tax=Leptospira yasudae TaxID=2202201 RepID=A0A6N4QKS0_9LEPT|nr:SRPBCC family protein [Leptospira yasudae]TGL83071.1 SRPBCC domain-containing protein [Leptospira yasudae]TGL83618.1 SRPBCC domain-containing protein [Leptospira yasudae]TGL85698.1 SRPBCC domain-containing protein [Leptospira yasudae]